MASDILGPLSQGQAPALLGPYTTMVTYVLVLIETAVFAQTAMQLQAGNHLQHRPIHRLYWVVGGFSGAGELVDDQFYTTISLIPDMPSKGLS